MAKEPYTKEAVRYKLEKRGCKISGDTIQVANGRLGIGSLGMIDFLVKQCKMVVKHG